MKTPPAQSLPWQETRRILTLVVVLLLGAGAGWSAPGRLTVTVLDCQLHGLAVVLQTPGGQTWLVDTGPNPKGDNNPTHDVIAPFLQKAGVQALDGVLVSHPHGDHRGGLPYLMQHYRIAQLVDAGYDEIGGAELEAYRQTRAQYVAGGVRSVIVKLGAKLAIDPVLDVEVLWPPAGLHRPDPKRKDEALYNSNSIVLRVRHGANVFLFPGDHHGIAGLGKFVAPEKVKCDLLVAPHHGLNSIPAMAVATKPKFVIVPSLQEYLNPLIRPYELTKSAFDSAGSTVYATWMHGTITAVSDGRSLQVTTTRQP